MVAQCALEEIVSESDFVVERAVDRFFAMRDRGVDDAGCDGQRQRIEGHAFGPVVVPSMARVTGLQGSFQVRVALVDQALVGLEVPLDGPTLVELAPQLQRLHVIVARLHVDRLRLYGLPEGRRQRRVEQRCSVHAAIGVDQGAVTPVIEVPRQTFVTLQMPGLHVVSPVAGRRMHVSLVCFVVCVWRPWLLRAGIGLYGCHVRLKKVIATANAGR